MKRFITASLLLSLFANGALAGKTNTPALKCQPGWRSEIVAQAPAIQAPSVVCCSPDGRIFMGEDFMDMGSPTDKPGDKIVCIYPNGKIKVFATNLYAVFGMEYIDGKLYVHHSPKFSVFDDVEGVGKHRVDIITQDNPHPWAPSFNDHIPSGFHLGMDGYFYISTGDKGILGAVGTDGRKIEMRGGIYRMRPDGTGLEVYCTGTRNHLDIAFNSEDEMFTEDNTDDGAGWWTRLTHMVDGGYYGYPFDYKTRQPYTLWMITDYDGCSGAPTGALMNDEDALPEEYRGNMFACDWAGAEVLRLRLKRAGSTYGLESRVQFNGTNRLTTIQRGPDFDFVTRGDFGIAFRPVGITVTPDGMGFYVTDWGVSGWKKPDILGRLFKVTYGGKSLAAPKPKWYLPAAMGQPFKASTAELVKALSHPSRNVRMVAERRLAERHEAGEKKLAALLKNTKAPPYARWSAVWTLDAIDGGKSGRKAILAALNDRDPTVQAQAARELGTRRSKEAVPPLVKMLDNTNAMLRFRAATALGRIADPAAIRPLELSLIQTDLFAHYADFKALNRAGLADSRNWPEIVEGLVNDNSRIRDGVYFATRETYDVGLIKALAAFSGRPGLTTAQRTNVLRVLSGLYQTEPKWNGDWWNTMPANSSPPAKSVDWEGSPLVANAMREALRDSSEVVRQIAFDWVRNSHDTNSAAMLRSMFERETNAAMRATILRALPAVNDTNNHTLISGLLKDPQTPPALLEAAIEMAEKIGGNQWNADLVRLTEKPLNDRILQALFPIFGKNKLTNTIPLLGTNLTSPNSALRQAAAAALTQIGGDRAIEEFLPGLDAKATDIRRQSIEALGTLKAKPAVPQLVKIATNDTLSTAAIQSLADIADMRALDIYLDGLASKNAAIRSVCKTAVTMLRADALPRIEARVKSTNGLPDETIDTLKRIYQNDVTAKKGPLFKVRVKLIPIADYASFALAHLGSYNQGENLFTDVNGPNCVRCHRLNGKGALVGPDLTGIGARQSREQIIESVLYPSKQILDGYQQIIFEMKDDEDASGIVRAETAETVAIIDSLGKTNILQKSKIKGRKTSQISLMPEGLQTGLTQQQFSDLITYVENPSASVEKTRDVAGSPQSKTKEQPADPLDFLKLPSLPVGVTTEAEASMEDAPVPVPTELPLPQRQVRPQPAASPAAHVEANRTSVPAPPVKQPVQEDDDTSTRPPMVLPPMLPGMIPPPMPPGVKAIPAKGPTPGPPPPPLPTQPDPPPPDRTVGQASTPLLPGPMASPSAAAQNFHCFASLFAEHNIFRRA